MLPTFAFLSELGVWAWTVKLPGPKARTLKPASLRILVASFRGLPSTFGTLIASGPRDTSSVIVSSL